MRVAACSAGGMEGLCDESGRMVSLAVHTVPDVLVLPPSFPSSTVSQEPPHAKMAQSPASAERQEAPPLWDVEEDQAAMDVPRA